MFLPFDSKPRFVALLAVVWLSVTRALFAETLDADLLVVGGSESACAAAVQAARLGVKRIVLVNDIAWLGGQFSAEGVGCPDEWTTVRGKKVNFPRSGLFLEMIQRVRAHNSQTYGIATPGNSWCGTETIEPAAAAQIFEDLVAPFTEQGTQQLRIVRGWQPMKVDMAGTRVAGVTFERTDGSPGELAVRAHLTIDSSDWGDVIRLSGARYGAGPDLQARFHEPSAPEAFIEGGQQEMNPLTWCLVLREAGRDATIPRPPSYDVRSYAALDKTPPWVDWAGTDGIYAPSGWSIYTHRRLVDRWHFGFHAGTEALFVNWPVQDYPLCQLPQRVRDALEATGAGASRKNLVDLTPRQRRIIFDDVKQHALGMLYHLQTKVHDRVGDFPQSFRYLALTDEFGTPDRLPFKPYVREGLRLEALYMLREQDIRAATREPKWAKVMVPDAVFGFQFNIDFHPTRRKFLANDDPAGPWQYIHTPNRNWHTDTDRAMFPLRGLVPVARDGLLGAGKNIGVSSVVQSALRLHGQMMMVGQASGTLAWMALRDGVEPRVVAADFAKVRELQQRLVRGCGGPGVLLWPWQDLTPDAAWFEAANLLAVRGIWQADAESVAFAAEKVVSATELAGALTRLGRALAAPQEWSPPPDFPSAAPSTWALLHAGLASLGLPADQGLTKQKELPLTRGECVRFLWAVLQQAGEWHPTTPAYLTSGHDSDGDGLADLDDALPFDHNNTNLPDRLRTPAP
jgi:hypothetical protein